MKYTQFAKRLTKMTGIGSLMEDMGAAVQEGSATRMLGGGNPALIPEVNALWRRRIEEMLAKGTELEEALTYYDSPQGKRSFIDALAGLLNDEFNWNLGAENIAITNGSQTALFMLFNILAGTGEDGAVRRLLFPMSPEYIGYADQLLDGDAMCSLPATIEETRPHFFKYHVDFNSLAIGEEVSALCVSRPTNPTGNVLTDEEIRKLSRLSANRDIPLIIDNAYGAPFPNILFKSANAYWDSHIILSMSLSKLGLPALRTGIIVASREIISALSACNAVVSLANVSFGQVLVKPLIDSKEILAVSRNLIRPFYQQRLALALEALQEAFGNDFLYFIHEPEGAFFLWLWFPGLSISSMELYERLKRRGVVVVSGHYFFYGLDCPWEHTHECLRLSYAPAPEQFREAVEIIADEIRRAGIR
ncbi:MAG: valine--pyruvate transaminase [Spirochaeta sp. LUC14_002_19_P3]|nr:MAG: valine--pyruvate transaminase [Spirochaeta sp. LUC14_002_19_P3]